MFNAQFGTVTNMGKRHCISIGTKSAHRPIRHINVSAHECTGLRCGARAHCEFSI